MQINFQCNILTSFNEKYWEEIAKNTTELLDNHWPENQNIFLYHEFDVVPNDLNLSNRIVWKNLYVESPNILKFIDDWKEEPRANGFNGTKFKFNAIKFSHKTFAIWDCYKKLKSGYFIWIDCDACLYKQIDYDFLNKILPTNEIVSYLGRKEKYSECGFLAFNLDHPLTEQFLQEWEELFRSGNFINLRETHDSFTFDYLRLKWNNSKLFKDLNKDSTTDKNPFGNSLLGTHFAHAKGSDKGAKIGKILNNMKKM
jgi:hypothetical protein